MRKLLNGFLIMAIAFAMVIGLSNPITKSKGVRHHFFSDIISSRTAFVNISRMD